MGLSPLNLKYYPLRGFQLTVTLTFNARAHKTYLDGQSVQELVCQGIQEKWSGFYPVTPEIKSACDSYFNKISPGSQLSPLHKNFLPYRVILKLDPKSGLTPPRLNWLKGLLSFKQRPIPIFVRNTKLLPSHVASGIFRRFWGVFKYGRALCLGYNWSRNWPGYAVIHNFRQKHLLQSIAAHEFGHLCGLDDAYAAWYRLYYPAPGTEDFMMHYNRQVQAEEIAMVIKAYALNRIQFFPIKWEASNFKQGLKKELAYYGRKIQNLGKK